MSTTDASGRASEQQLPPMLEAGCESKVDRSVRVTGRRTGFAELRARAIEMRNEAVDGMLDMKKAGFENAMYVNGGIHMASIMFLQWIDAIEADAKDAST